MKKAKITVIGAGNVGITLTQRLAEKNFANIVCIDVMSGSAKGKALDMMESAPILGFDTKIIGTSDYACADNSDIVVITAGLARKPGMTREDLLLKNATIITDITKKITAVSPNAIYIVVSNPVDMMTALVQKIGNLPQHKVIGMGGVLDSARFATFIAMEAKVSVKNVYASVLGGHGDLMVPLPRYSNISGVPITEIFDKETIDRLVDRTRNGGAEIVNLIQTGSAYYAPSAATFEMINAIFSNKHQILPCISYLNGEYGLKDIYVGVMTQLYGGGVEKVVEYKLTNEEHKAFAASADKVKTGIDELNTLLANHQLG